MTMYGSKPCGEDVRLRAVKLVCEEGWKPAEVATAIGCSIRSIQLWVQKSSRGRKKSALITDKAPGATPKLDSQQKQRLLKLLAAGPEVAGFEGQLWTCARINELIQKEFDVSYHVRSLPALLKSLGWSVQKPKRRAMERNEQAIEGWVANGWPRIKKTRKLGATLVFFDETGFITQPYAGRTWAPIGETPVVRHRLRHREKVTVLGSLTVSPLRRRCGLF